MRSHAPWLVAGFLSLSMLAPSAVGAQADTTPNESTTNTELAPGESPGGLDAESGPVLTLLIEEPQPEATDVEPAGPTIFDPVAAGPSGGLDNNSKTILFILMITAVPSLTVGTALWLQRDRAVIVRGQTPND